MAVAMCLRKVPVIRLACSFLFPWRYGTVPERLREVLGSTKLHGPKVTMGAVLGGKRGFLLLDLDEERRVEALKRGDHPLHRMVSSGKEGPEGVKSLFRLLLGVAEDRGAVEVGPEQGFLMVPAPEGGRICPVKFVRWLKMHTRF